jgi:hypothetical protein
MTFILFLFFFAVDELGDENTAWGIKIGPSLSPNLLQLQRSARVLHQLRPSYLSFCDCSSLLPLLSSLLSPLFSLLSSLSSLLSSLFSLLSSLLSLIFDASLRFKSFPKRSQQTSHERPCCLHPLGLLLPL